MRQGALVALCATLFLGTPASTLSAADDGNIAVVSFGIGLNTAVAPPANGEPNHHVLPQTVRIKKGGVVNFMVAGFHEIWIYQPGVSLEEIQGREGSTMGPFIGLTEDLFYRGIIPAGGPFGTAPTANPSNAVNRLESVAFLEPGKYLVICNVRGHFLDGMYAWVIVSNGNDKDDSKDNGKPAR